MGQNQSNQNQSNENSLLMTKLINFFDNYENFLKEFQKENVEISKKRSDMKDSNDIQIYTINKYITDIDNQINNKLIISSYKNDYNQIKEHFLAISKDYNNLNNMIHDQPQKVDENLEKIEKIYEKYKTVINKESNVRNVKDIHKELSSYLNIISNSTIETTKYITDGKLVNLTKEYTTLQNKAQCNEPNWPNLYNNQCYSKCPIDSTFMIDINGNPVCNQTETIKEDKTLNREVYKCPDGFFYKKEKNGKEICISCPENYIYMKNTNGEDYCLENCHSEYVLDKDNNCKITKEYKLYQKEKKDPEICPIGYSMKELNGNYKCIEDCPTGYVLDRDNICRPGYSPKEKTVCPTGYKLHKVNNQYICFEDCPENYKLEKDNICKYVNSYTPMISNYNTLDISCNNNDYDYINGSCYKKCYQNYSTYSKDPTKCVIDTCVKPFERIEENNRIYCHQIQNKQFIPDYRSDFVSIKPVRPDDKQVKMVPY